MSAAGSAGRAAGSAGPAGAVPAARLPRRRSPALPPSPAQLCSSGPLSPSRRAGAPGAVRFVFLRCPPLLFTPGPLFRRPGRFVRPVAPRILSPSLSCPSSWTPLLSPSLLGSLVTCHSPGNRFLSIFIAVFLWSVSLSPFWLVRDYPRRLCLPHPVAYLLGTLFTSHHRLIYPLPTVFVG